MKFLKFVLLLLLLESSPPVPPAFFKSNLDLPTVACDGRANILFSPNTNSCNLPGNGVGTLLAAVAIICSMLLRKLNMAAQAGQR